MASQKIPFQKLKGWDRFYKQQAENEKLAKRAKPPKRLIALDPRQISKIYLAEIGADPMRYVGIRKMKPDDLAELLHTWGDKENTTLVMVRQPTKPIGHYRREDWTRRVVMARYMAVMMGRYRQAWHQPFVRITRDAIAFALFERRWPVDRNALAHRLRNEFKVPYGSGIYCPPEGQVALAACYVAARAWRGMEWRHHSSG
ncbi:MAG TPA: hypothetical protein VMY37_17240 [Thermoguttaceae bacterium]|nr:hypothetical protein [Thermoguttaceae bacterium]